MKTAPIRTVPADRLTEFAEDTERALSMFIGAMAVVEAEFPGGMTPEAKRAFEVMRKQVAYVFEDCGRFRAVALGLYEDIEKPRKATAKEATP